MAVLGPILTALLLFAASSSASAEDVVMKPANTTGTQIGVVVIQGAQITPDKYVPLINVLQNISKYSLWVGIPEFPLDIPEPVVISGGVSRILQSMQNGGMPKTAKIFFIAHSLGGIILQDYLASNPSLAAGQVLMGSFLLSKYRGSSYKVPTMTLGGELDGLCQVTRIMEEFYFRNLITNNTDRALADFPVLVIRGMSHIQFASDPPPPLIKQLDLKPEISNTDAHEIVAGFISSFIMVQMGNTRIGLMPLVDASHATAEFFKPIIAAYKMEGFYSFKPPCNSNPVTTACALGSPWSESAQQIMGGLTTATVNDTDAFHPVYQINPVHLPHVNTKCAKPDSSCVLQTNTVTQNVYEALDSLDTGFVSTSANEMRVKLKSRQAVMVGAGYTNVDFNSSDGSSLCKVINEASYKWALQNAGSSALARFQENGVQMVMGEDEGPYNEGPVWIWKPLAYSNGKDASTGRQTRVVRSVMMRTPIDYWISAAAGMHYCKLLSPARATEWIYVDGLRKYYGI